MYLHKNIKYLRKSTGVSQKDLGSLLDVVPNQISKYERGASNPPIDKIMLLVDYFNVGLEDFVLADLSKGERYDGRSLEKASQQLYEKIIASHERELRQLKRAVRRSDPALAEQLGINED